MSDQRTPGPWPSDIYWEALEQRLLRGDTTSAENEALASLRQRQADLLAALERAWSETDPGVTHSPAVSEQMCAALAIAHQGEEGRHHDAGPGPDDERGPNMKDVG